MKLITLTSDLGNKDSYLASVKGAIYSELENVNIVDIKYISLVNLILDKKLIPELIQAECKSLNIEIELEKLIKDPEHAKRVKNGYQEIKMILGSEKVSNKVADQIVKIFS